MALPTPPVSRSDTAKMRSGRSQWALSSSSTLKRPRASALKPASWSTVNGPTTGLPTSGTLRETDATLLTDSATESVTIDAVTFDYHYPSRSDCLVCHNRSAGFVNGLRSRQLNRDFIYPLSGRTDNQLRALDQVGLFNPSPDLSKLDRIVTNVPLHDAGCVRRTSGTIVLGRELRSVPQAESRSQQRGCSVYPRVALAGHFECRRGRRSRHHGGSSCGSRRSNHFDSVRARESHRRMLLDAALGAWSIAW